MQLLREPLALAALLIAAGPTAGFAEPVAPRPLAPAWPDVEAVRESATVLPLYTADPDHSSLAFMVRHLMLTKVRGRFHGWHAALSYDPDDLVHSSVTVVVDVASLDTDNGMRDRDLRSEHFFDTERFPTAVFQSTGLRPAADGFVAEGMLRIRDVARKVEIPFVHTGSFTSPSGRSQREGFEASLTLKRADYGVVHEGNILETSGAIGKDVTIEIELSAVRLHWEAFPFRGRDAEPTLGERLLALVDSEGPAAAVEHYRQALESSAEPAATSAQDMAILSARLAAGDHASTAARLLELYAGSEPESDDAQLLAADALLRIGSQEAALAYYRKASALAPERVEAVERIRALTGRANEATLIQPTR